MNFKDFLIVEFLDAQRYYINSNNTNLSRFPNPEKDIFGYSVDFVDVGIQYIWQQWQRSAEITLRQVNKLIEK